jgi:hypothetical protein
MSNVRHPLENILVHVLRSTKHCKASANVHASAYTAGRLVAANVGLTRRSLRSSVTAVAVPFHNNLKVVSWASSNRRSAFSR